MRQGILPTAAALALLLVSPCLSQPQDGLSTAFLDLALKGKTPVEIKGTLVLRSSQTAVEPIRLPVSSLEPIPVKLPPGSTWEVGGELPGFWVQRKTLEVPPAGQEIRIVLDLWPMGSISGVVKVKRKGDPLPRQVFVKTLVAPAFAKRVPAPKGALDCPVDEKGAWSCPVPAATYDLVISAAGYIPFYHWGVEVPAASTRPLGTLELVPGASVAGWVAVEGGAIEPGECVVRLSKLLGGGSDPQAAAATDLTAVEQSVRTDGFFQLAGIAPDTYALEVRQPGYGTIRLAPVRIKPQTETILEEPLVLKRPLALSFEISPPRDWLSKPWQVKVFRQSEGDGRPNPIVFEGRAEEDGRLTVSGQSRGRFQVQVLDSIGNRMSEVEVTADQPAFSPEVIEIDLITLEGTLWLGQEPLAADLWFGGRSGATRIRMASDEEGRFRGVLPRGGDWRVDIHAIEPRLNTRARVDVSVSKSGRAAADIVLPDTRVFGAVVDESGKPVPGADVLLQSERVEVFETADEFGAFEARGMPEGPAWLAAGVKSRSSGRTLITLTAGRAVGPVELRLRNTRQLSGKVVSPTGPVAGARVDVLVSTPPAGGGSARSQADGTFQVEIPEKAQRFVAIVSAPGFSLKAFEGSTGAPLSLPVAQEGGTLEIEIEQAVEELLQQDLAIHLFQNGLHVPPYVVGQWARDHGQSLLGNSLRLPSVAPGEYRACVVPARLPLEGDPAAAGAQCHSGFLFAGSSLSLKVKAD